MIESNYEDLSINRQCNILSVSRSRVYYKPVERNNDLDEVLTKAIDKQHLKCPFYGFRRILSVTIVSLAFWVHHFDSKSLWTSVKSLVWEQENVNACWVFDDCIFEKQYTDENPLIYWHWDHVKGRSTKGINLLSAFYVTQKDGQTESLGLPIMYELILKTVLYCLVKTKRETRKSPITKNKLMQTMIQQCINNQLIFKYILADSWFALTDNMHFIQSKKKFFIFDLQNNRLAILADSATENLLKKLNG